MNFTEQRDAIVAECLAEHGVKWHEILSLLNRSRRICDCRGHIAVRLHDELGMSYIEVAMLMGRRAHSGVHTSAKIWRGRSGEVKEAG